MFLPNLPDLKLCLEMGMLPLHGKGEFPEKV
jgi:hypothetical protein